MAWSPTISAYDRVSSQANLINGLSSRREFGFGDKIIELVPNATPYQTMLMKLSNTAVDDPHQKYMEHRPEWLEHHRFYSNATNAPACSATNAGQAFSTWAVQKSVDGTDSVGFLRVGLIIQVRDADDPSKHCNFLITAVNSQVSIDVEQITETPGFSVADNDEIYTISSAFAENAAKTTGHHSLVDVHWASCQIMKTLLGVSRTLKKLRVRGGNEYARLLSEKLIEHKIDLERGLFFNERVTNESGSNDPWGEPLLTALGGTANGELRTSIGIAQACQYADDKGMGGSRVFNITKATYTYSDLIDDFEEQFEYGSDTKYAVCGSSVISFFNKLAMSTQDLKMVPGQNSLGIDIVDIMAAGSRLRLVKHPLFKGVWKNQMFVTDMDYIDMITFEATMLERDVQTPGTDGSEDQYLTDQGLIVSLPEAHGAWNFA